MLSIEALFTPMSVDREHEAYGLSVAPRGRFPTVEAVHSYGLRVAEAANARMAARKGTDLTEEERCHYLGYYEFAYSTVLDLVKPRHTVGVTWVPEQDLDEHCEMFVRWNGLEATNKQRKQERRLLVTEIPHFLSGLERYTHPYGHPLAEQLNKVVLPMPPLAQPPILVS